MSSQEKILVVHSLSDESFIQTCSTEDEAREFVANLNEGNGGLGGTFELNFVFKGAFIDLGDDRE